MNPEIHPNLHLVRHPLAAFHLSEIRDASTPAPLFRKHIEAAARILAIEATRSLETETREVSTPLEITSGTAFARPQVLVPILRAGLGFLTGFLEILPWARVGHLGMARNESTLEPEPYYSRLPPGLSDAEVLLLDPMLATGGSAVAAIQSLRDAGARSIRFCCLVASPEGLAALARTAPEVPVFTAALDRELNAVGYILPGLGDAGDRYFGT